MTRGGLGFPQMRFVVQIGTWKDCWERLVKPTYTNNRNNLWLLKGQATWCRCPFFKVINFDMPKEIENYVHRIGRTGIVGFKEVISLCTSGAKDGSIIQVDSEKRTCSHAKRYFSHLRSCPDTRKDRDFFLNLASCTTSSDSESTFSTVLDSYFLCMH